MTTLGLPVNALKLANDKFLGMSVTLFIYCLLMKLCLMKFKISTTLNKI